MKIILSLILTIHLTLIFNNNAATAQGDNLKNRPELSLPLTNEKLVIAHNMTAIIRYKNHTMEDCSDPEYYPRKGNITETIGGMVQINPIADRYMKDSTLEQSVEFEIRAAMRCGIDGFQFYYPIRQRSADDEIIKTYFKVAEREKLDFKFTLCPSHPSGLTEAIKIEDYAKRMNGIFDEVGHDNPHWLRTPDGRLILYLWYGEQLADIPTDLNGYSRQYYQALAYEKLEKKVNENFACILSVNHEIGDEELNGYLDYFPATWVWTLPYTDNYIGKKIATISKERNRTFTGSIFSSFYTSKLLKPKTWDMYEYAEDAANAKMENLERRGIVTGLSYNFRKLLEFAIEKDVPLINVITWNDYPEGHHLAPEVNHNYGFSVLLNYYKSLWKGEPSPYSDRDVAIVFFKKYKHNIAPEPFNIPIVYLSYAVPEAAEDSIEVVTILKNKAKLTLNNSTIEIPAGLVATKFESKAGRVDVKVEREKKEVINFFAPEWITDKPYRTDRLIFSFSSEYARFHHDIFGNKEPVFSREYDKEMKKIVLENIENLK